MSGDLPLFSASTTSTSHIYRVLKAISLVSKDAAITISSQGVKVSADSPNHTCQAHVFLADSLFTTYQFLPPDQDNPFVTFGVSLASLISCLQMFAQDQPSAGSNSRSDHQAHEIVINTTCRFIYEGTGHPFVLLFKEGRTINTKCKFITTATARSLASAVNDDDDEYDDDAESESELITIDADNIVQKIIISGQIMSSAFKELQIVNTNVVTFRASSLRAPHFTMISHGPIGSSKIVFPNEKNVLETFVVSLPAGEVDVANEHSNIVVVNSYLFEYIDKAREAVNLASRVSLRSDSDGILSLQCMCEVGDGRQSFIDFRCLPCEPSETSVYT